MDSIGIPFLSSPSLAQEEMPIMPADHRSHLFPKRARHFVRGVDDYAQLLGLKACKKNVKYDVKYGKVMESDGK